METTHTLHMLNTKMGEKARAFIGQLGRATGLKSSGVLAAVNCGRPVICNREMTQDVKHYHMLLWHPDGMFLIDSVLPP